MVEKLEKIIGGYSKGQYISPEILENLFGFSRTTSQYQFKLLSLESEIKESLRERGILVSIRSDKYGIKILSDREASEHNINRIGKGLRVLEDAQTDLLNVDVNNLEKQEEEVHNKRIVFGSRIIDAIKTEFKKDVPVKISYRSMLPRLFK
jgi:hypothetical protein